MVFQVIRPTKLSDLWNVFTEYPDAYPIAGGTDILPRLNQGIEHHDVFVSLEGIQELREISFKEDGSVSIGALTKLVEITETPGLNKFKALNHACSKVASPQIRNQATIGGNVLQENRCVYFNQSVSWRRIESCFKLGGDRCYQYTGSPKCVALFQSDVAPVLMSYGANAVWKGAQKTRTVPLSSIYMEAGKKDKAPDEILTELIIPPFSGVLHSVYVRETIRKSFDFPLVSCALTIIEKDSTIDSACMVMGSAGVMPRIVPEVGDLLLGLKINDLGAKVEELRTIGSKVVFPFKDSRTDTVTRKNFAKALIKKAINSIINEQ